MVGCLSNRTRGACVGAWSGFHKSDWSWSWLSGDVINRYSFRRYHVCIILVAGSRGPCVFVAASFFTRGAHLILEGWKIQVCIILVAGSRRPCVFVSASFSSRGAHLILEGWKIRRVGIGALTIGRHAACAKDWELCFSFAKGHDDAIVLYVL